MQNQQQLDSADVRFAANVNERHDNTRKTTHRYEPIGESFTLRGGFDEPINRRYEPLAAPISLREGQTAQTSGSDGNASFMGDVGKTLAGSAIKGAGAAVRGIGKVPQALGTIGATALNQAVDADLPMPGNVLDGAADWVNRQGQSLLDSRSPASILAEQNSTPDGSIADPSTITWGDDPSVKGYILQGARALGSMAPVLLAGWVGRLAGGTGIVSSAATGGSQGAGAAIEQARATIDRMDDETLERESETYRQMLASGATSERARAAARAGAENWAAAFTAPVSTLGGAATGKILSPAGRVFGAKGVAGQTTGRAALSGLEEGVQEVAEGAATQHGTNVGAGTDLNLGEGSFGNLVQGVMGGAGPGSVRGAIDGLQTRKIPVTDKVLESDITNNGRSFITLPAAQRAAAAAGEGHQVFRYGNRFIVRKTKSAGTEFVEGLRHPEESNGAQADQPSEEQKTDESPATQGEFQPGQTVYLHQNGRSMPVEFVGYERNAATERPGGVPVARVRTADGRGRFVNVSDLQAEEPAIKPSQPLALGAPAERRALGAPPAKLALPSAANVTAAGEGFITRPAWNMPHNAPRGIRNNNPGNIGRGAGFDGEVEGSDARFATFDSPEAGIRAIARNLLTYQEKYGLSTVRQLIGRWAPVHENDTDGYVKAVSKFMGVEVEQALDLRDPATMRKLVTAIIRQENGIQPYGSEQIGAGVISALRNGPIRAGFLPPPTVSVTADGMAMTADQRTWLQQAQGQQADDKEVLGVTLDIEQARKQHPINLEQALAQAATSPHNDLPEPTEAQKRAGNYKKAHITLDGLDITIENPEGSTRSGIDRDGKRWSTALQHHYGYLKGTQSADGDHVDVFIKPGVGQGSTAQVYVVDQVDPKTGKFDEHKVMIGFGSQQEAEAAYKANYQAGWKGMAAVTPMSLSRFKSWLNEGNTSKPVADKVPTEELGLGRLSGKDVHAPGGDGRSTATIETPAGRQISVRYRVVDAGDLITSNKDDGRVNPAYPAELQPRDRSRGASELQINDIASNIRPALLGASATTSDGAPVISPAGVVESGNGRTLAIKRAYDRGLPSAAVYRKWLEDQGYDVAGMRAPVLVRQRETELNAAELQAYTRESNERTTLQMSATEQAASDAKSVRPILDDYQSGDVGAAANRDFVRKFIRDIVSKSDQGSMIDANGLLSQYGKKRIEGALMSAAYDSPEIVADLFESSDNDIKAIGGALLDVAGQWAQMRESAQAGAIPADMDLTLNLVGAVNLVRRARAEGKGIHDLAYQQDLVAGTVDEATIQFLHTFFRGPRFTRTRSRQTVAQTLNEYLGIVQSIPAGENMFGDRPPSGEQVIRMVNERRRSEEASEQSQFDPRQTGNVSSVGEPGQAGRGSGTAGIRGREVGRGERSRVEDKRDGQTIDMFAGQGQVQRSLYLPHDGTKALDSGRRGARVPAFPSPTSRARAVFTTPGAQGKSAAIVESKQTDTVSVADGKIKTADDAAHALASLRKLPQENVVALLTDQSGRPISILRHTMSRTSQAEVMPAILAGHVARYKNAAHVWLAHNHPSGTAELSDQDIAMTRRYAEITNGTQAKLKGMLAIAGSRYAFFSPMGERALTSHVAIPPRARTRRIPVVERRFRRAATLGSESIRPDSAPALVRQLLEGQSGILLFDAQNKPVATLPMGVEEMRKLRGTGGIDKVFAGVERANASGAMVYIPEGERDLKAARNLATLLDQSGDVRMLDIISSDQSLAARGLRLTRRDDIAESRDPLMMPYHLGISVRETQAMVDRVRAKLPGASEVSIQVVENRLDVNDIEGRLPSMGAEGIYFPATKQADGKVKPARIYLIAANLESLARADQVLAHELVGHFGLEAMLGEHFSAVLEDVIRLSAVPAGVKIGAQRPGDKYYATMDAVRQAYPDYSPSNQAREVLARMAEMKLRPRFLERVWGYIRRFLSSIGLGGRYTNAEIKMMVVDAAKQLQRSSGSQAISRALDAAESLKAAGTKKLLTREIRALIERTKQPGNVSHKLVVSSVPDWLERAARQTGLQLAGYHHVIDSSSIRHVFKQHGDAAKELARGQLPISVSDFEAIPNVLAQPDKLVFGTKNRIGRNQVVYIKRLDDGTTLYLEEVRTGRRELASQSMRKYPATMNVDHVISTLYPNARSDGGSELILMDGPDPRNIHDDSPESVKPYVELTRKDGKSWLMRSSAQKIAEEHGGRVLPRGEGWIVRRDGSNSSAASRPSYHGDVALLGAFSKGVRSDQIESESRNAKAPPSEGFVTSGRSQVQTPAFKKWFGASKVVDANGRPLVVYHGTDQSFDVFEGGGWFTPIATDASVYSKTQTPGAEHTPNVMPVYLSIRKPKFIDTYATRSDIEKARVSGKYDGVIIRGVGGGSIDHYVAFHPEQVKSATGNRGTFDASNPNILESRATTVDEVAADRPKPERYRADVARPGEKLTDLERSIRQRALGKIGAFSKVEPIQTRARKLAHNWQAKAVQGIFDQFAPLKGLDTKAYMQARLSKGSDGAVEALFTTGKARLTDGALDVDNSGGLLKVLQQLDGEHDHFFAWIAGNRAKRLMGEGRERLFTDKDIEVLTGLNQGKMHDGRSRGEVYAKALQEFNALQASVLDVAQEAGLIDPESRKLWEHEFYVPFYRVMEEDATGTMGPGQISGLVGQRAFKRLRGGEEKLGDLLANTLSNWSHLLSASMKNLAAQQALKAAVELGIAEKVPAAEKGSVRIMEKGKERHFVVDEPLVLDALTALHYVGHNTVVMKAMRRFKHYLTMGVTISPTFRIRNLARDVISAMATSDVSYNPMKNLAEGWKGTQADSPTMRKLLAGGGAVRFGSLNDGDQAANAKRLIGLGVQAGQILDTQVKVMRALRSAWDGYQAMGDRAETVNRAAIYEKAIRDGKTHLEASFMARDLMDFTAGGKFASVRLLSQVVPFFNARLQGMYKLGRAAKDDPRRFGAVTGAVAMASALLYLVGADDDDYKALPDWVRNTYWVVRLPGADKFVYIPKPFEVGALGTVVERMTELAIAGDDYQVKDFAKSLTHVLSDQLAMNPVPQLFKPAMGVAFNYDDFRGVDIDSPHHMRLPAQDRHTARTSAGAIALGQAFNTSPQRLEFLMRGYFGWLGTQALNVADLIARPFTDLPANPARDLSRVDNWFIAGDFIKEPDIRSSKYVQRFYDQQREIEQIYAAYSEARKTGDLERALDLARRGEIRLRPLYQSANKQMQAINRRIRLIDADRAVYAASKSVLRDRLYQQRNRLAMVADERFREGL